MAKIRLHSGGLYVFNCPGCKSSHYIPIEGPKAWAWNGSLDAPTFKPSIVVWTEEYREPNFLIPATRCHSYVTDGSIQFLGDCTHELAGKTVPLPEIEGGTHGA